MTQNQSTLPLKMLLFSFHATNTIIISFLPLYLGDKGLSGTEIGYVLAIGPLASIFSQPFWGFMSDKYKTIKRILLILIISLLLTSIVFFQMNQLMWILIIGAVLFFFSTPIGALGDSLAQRRADDLNISFGSIKTWGSIGFATSSLLIGQLLAQIGIENMIWPYLFFGTLTLVVIFRLTDVEVVSDPIQFKDLSALVKNKPYLIFLGLILFFTIAHRANDSFMGLYIVELGGSENLVGLAWFVGVVSEALIFASAGWWFKKYQTFVFVIGAGILYTLRWFLFASLEDPMHLIYLQFLHGLTFGVFYTAAFEYITRLIPKLLQSTGHLVFYSVFFGVSGIIGSLVGGTVIDNYSGSTLYIMMGYLSLIGVVLFTIYHVFPFRKNKKRLMQKSSA